jgi:hypothetical protein
VGVPIISYLGIGVIKYKPYDPPNKEILTMLRRRIFRVTADTGNGLTLMGVLSG